jgi:predicted phosphate transport protein (TIGR00153 family)
VFERLLPREFGFFDHFERHVDLSVQGAKLFVELLDDLASSGPRAKRIKEVEHEADVITHQTVEMLHKTFITPIDRDDIHRLISRMDDILDDLEAAAERLTLYEITTPKPEAKDLARILVAATEQLRVAVGGLRNLKRDQQKILAACVDINRLENEGDALLRTGLAKLFREEKDALVVMKWKEVYENLEGATDRCEDVANIIEGVVLENA